MTNIICLIFGHKWDMYRGYEGWKVHDSATCKRCNAKAREVKHS